MIKLKKINDITILVGKWIKENSNDNIAGKVVEATVRVVPDVSSDLKHYCLVINLGKKSKSKIYTLVGEEDFVLRRLLNFSYIKKGERE